MPPSPVITVVVPGFDVAEYAQEAIDSLVRQTRGDWTAVLVDDASTDATAAIFAEAAARDPRFRVIRHATRRGLGAARNTGVDAVDTPFLGFLDADDVLVPTAFERLLGTLEATGSDFAVGAYVRLRPDASGAYAPGVVQPWVSAATDPERRGTTIDAHPEASGNIVAWSKVTRTDFWRRAALRFPEGKLYEDQVVAALMYARSHRFDTIPDAVVLWRERADGSSITQGKASLPVMLDYLEAMAGGIAVLEAAGHRDAVRARVRLIQDMDLPPLVAIAVEHSDDAYRRALGSFVRDLAAHAPDVPPSDAASVAALW